MSNRTLNHDYGRQSAIFDGFVTFLDLFLIYSTYLTTNRFVIVKLSPGSMRIDGKVALDKI